MPSTSDVIKFYFQCEDRAYPVKQGKMFRPEDKEELSKMIHELVNDHTKPGLDIGTLARFVNHNDPNKNDTSRGKHFSRINGMYYQARDQIFMERNELRTSKQNEEGCKMQDVKIKEFLMAYEKAEMSAPVDAMGGKVFLIKDKVNLAEQAIGLKERGLVNTFSQLGTMVTEFEISRGRCIDRKKSKAKHDMRIRTWAKDYLSGILSQDKASAVSKLHSYKLQGDLTHKSDSSIILKNLTESLDSVIFSAFRQGLDETVVKGAVDGSLRECSGRYKKHVVGTQLKEFLKASGITLDMAKAALEIE